MPTSRTIYVFRCGESGLYALTTDRSGKMLPSAGCCPAGWRFERSIALRSDESRSRDLVGATLAAIAKQGFYLSHVAIGALPPHVVAAHVDDANNTASTF